MNRKRTANVKITVRDLQGKVLETKEFHNLLTTVGLNMERDSWAGDVTDLKIKMLGVGSGATAPAIGQTTLVAEIFRKAITDDDKPGDGQYTTITYIAPAEAVGTIEELGWFAGVDAGAGIDTGIMISRVLYSRVKTNIESIEVERTDSVAEV